jgi:hypothetical protein
MAAPNALPDPSEPDDVPGPSTGRTPEPPAPDAAAPGDRPGAPAGPAPESPETDAAGTDDAGTDGAGTADAGPGDPAPVDVDAQWASIVAGLEDLSGLGPDDARRDPDDTAPPRDASSGGASTVGPGAVPGRDPLGSVPVAPWVRSTGPRDWPATPEVEALEEAESHFVPPDPPLVLGRDPLLTMAWALVVGVPVLLLVLLVVARPFPVVVAQVGGAAFLAGLAVLLWRMPHRRDEDDAGPGAVV